jgi:hypothetical protein
MWLKEQVLDAVRLKGIQETIAGFLNDQVLDSVLLQPSGADETK